MMRSRMMLAATLCLGAAGAAEAAPIRTLTDLQTVRVYEITFSTQSTDFSPNAAGITQRLADPLSATNFDITYVANEYYDVFYSDADGTPNIDGAYVTIEGVWRQNNGPGGMNINEVELRFGGASPHNQYADFVSHFVYGTGTGLISGSEANAVDHNLGTYPRFGNTSTTNLNDRFSLTVGWNGISTPEPSSAALFAFGAIGLAAWGRPRARR